MPVAGIFPTVAGDLEGAADAAGGQNHGFGAEHVEPAALAIVSKGADHAFAVLEQSDDGVLHVDVEAQMDSVILQRANHLEAGAVADVRQARIAVAAEITLQDAAVRGAVEERAPGFQLANAGGRFLGMQLGHAPAIQVLAAAHGVGKMDAPIVAVVNVRQRRGDSALGHDGVGLAEQGFRDQTQRDARG